MAIRHRSSLGIKLEQFCGQVDVVPSAVAVPLQLARLGFARVRSSHGSP